jgi:hypothetical protein
MPHDPVLWARFAAAALQGLVAQEEGGHTSETIDYCANMAARYADALSREWAKRFLQEVK